jgi:hypothetical protein
MRTGTLCALLVCLITSVAGPFPALVLVHTCGGLRPEIQDWTKNALARGYVAFVIDSLGPRGAVEFLRPDTDRPTLVLMGELDNETPPSDCLPRLEALKSKDAPDSLVQPVLLLELAGQIPLGEVLEVLVGERVELVLEPARQHALDLGLPALLLEP